MFTNRLIDPSRPRITFFLFLFILLTPKSTWSQSDLGPIAAWLEGYRELTDFKPVSLFEGANDRTELPAALEQGTIMQLNPQALSDLLNTVPPALLFRIPNGNGIPIELELAQVEITTPDFFVCTNSLAQAPYTPSIHYRGIIRGHSNSIAAISISSDGIMGMISDDQGVYELGKMEDGSDRYLLYRTQHLKALSPNNCFTEDESLQGDEGGAPSAEDRGIGCKVVQVYFECDYKLYTDKGSNTTTVSNYVSGLFNQIATLYANENIGMAISQIYVWTSPDPYTGYNSTSSVLNAFRQTRGSSFNGNLAHLLSTRSLGGGVAYVDVLCFKQYAFGVSAISTTYQNVPTYSWSTEVVTHELGHNLGAWHTHSCNWPNGPLDNCVAPEGSCSPGPAPVNGGTIMSYCHLTNYGINFNNGFGATPGARIRDKVLNGSCLTQSGVVPTGLSSSSITSNSAHLNWTPVIGATSYSVQYKLSAGSSWNLAGTSIVPTFQLNNLAANSTYQWQVKTDCSNYSVSASFSTISGGGGNSCNAPIGLTTTGISQTAATFKWNGVPGAILYTVQYKPNSSPNWLSAGSTNSNSLILNGLNPAVSYQWQVKANCSVWSATASFSTLSNGGGACNPPTNLSNNSIGSTYAFISWASVQGASNYSLQIKLASGGDWFTLGAVSVSSVVISGLQANTSYYWRVKANCSDYSVAKLLTTIGALTGDDTGQLSQPGLMPDAGANGLELFPNPAWNQLFVRMATEYEPTQKIQFCDVTGRSIREQNAEPVLDISDLEPGIYFLSLWDGNKKIATRRLVKL